MPLAIVPICPASRPLSARPAAIKLTQITEDRWQASLAGKPVRSVNGALDENLDLHSTAACFSGLVSWWGPYRRRSAIELTPIEKSPGRGRGLDLLGAGERENQ